MTSPTLLSANRLIDFQLWSNTDVLFTHKTVLDYLSINIFLALRGINMPH